MSGFIEGENRYQSTLFPESVDEYIEEDSVVRVIDVFIDRLDISGLGFKAEAAETGRPGYHPRTMLKIYVYGYLNRVHSSRRLERESRRNVELMWLTSRLAPDFKTIADFRKDNGEAIRLVCREFVMLCRKLNLIGDTLAIDGSKFKAVNNRDKNFTRAKMKRRLAEVEASIERYLDQLDQADRSAPPKDTRPLKDKIAALTEEMDRLKKFEVRMLEAPDQQLSLTDPDARSMKSRGGGIVGYNLQTAVDVDNHLIVSHDVTNRGSDRRQLTRIAKQAQAVLQGNHVNVLADRGYYNGDELRSCEDHNITAYVPNSVTSHNKAKGQFDRSACPQCSLKPRCTTGKNRRVSRWVHEEVVERAAARLAAKPDAMQIRRATVEHPYGTLKAWMGSTHFLTRTLDHVSTEMSLHVLAYNLKRVINLVGTQKLLEAI
jgi:transposase